ncbi:hypothetical protein BDV30DRAFT_203653 [Aspergillus minisclerotigenes]|uniref:Uncharacterized protein n=1 Tax=Aspergillus minisclerotigenes TaxID=656917 RepID=A0A5N6JHE6_9EURO|nr:hypothetical protein BDV30DRAFT_203653 [Aspergillus minisclerotigenes]
MPWYVTLYSTMSNASQGLVKVTLRTGTPRILICWEILAFSIMLFQHGAGVIIRIEGNPISCRCNSS